MSIMRRRHGWLVTFLLAVVGSAVAGVVLFTSSRAEEVDLTTAGFVPADATFYVALNTDLTSAPWVRAFDLVERMGRDDPEGDLRDSVEGEGGVDWDDDVAPFLGGNASIFGNGFDWESDAFIGGVVIKAKDADRAADVILRQANDPVTEGEYAGVPFRRFDDVGAVYLAVLDGHVVVTPNFASLRAVVDVQNGHGPALADDADFVRLRDELTGSFLGFVYVRPDRLISEAFAGFGLTDVRDLGPAAAGAPLAAVVGAAGDAFAFQAASVSTGEAPAMLAPRTSRFAPMLPADTMVFASTFGAGPAWATAIEAAGPAITSMSLDLFSPYPLAGGDPAPEMEAYCDEYPELCEEGGEPFALPFDAEAIEAGLAGVAELFALMDGEVAAGVWPGDQQEGNVIFLAEISDGGRAIAVLDELVAHWAMLPVEPVTIAGEDARIADGWFAYGVTDDYLFFGNPDAVEAVLAGVALPLTGSASYARAVDQMPNALGSYVFLNLFALVRADAGGLVPELDAAMAALDGLIINAVAERGVVRVTGVLTIRE